MITEIIIGILLLQVIRYLFKTPHGLPPGEMGYPILGYLPPRTEPITTFISRLQDKHGQIFSAKIGQRMLVFLTDFATIKATFGKAEFSGRPDFFTLRVLRRFQNKGVLFADGPTWHANRRMSLRVLRDFGLGKSSLSCQVEREVKHLIEELMKTEGSAAKIDWYLNVAVVNVILGITTGRRYEINDPLTAVHVKFITEATVSIGGAMDILNYFPWLIWALPRFVKNKLFQLDYIIQRTDDFLDYLRDIVREHEMTLDKENPRDFIDVYLIEYHGMIKAPESKLDNDDYFDLVSLLADLYAAGSETTSSMIRWYCFYMSKHPEIQKKVQQEIDSVVPFDRIPEYEDKKRLPYFEATIHETQRIVSLTPVGVPHSAVIDTNINGFKIPKGTVINPCVSLCHGNPKYWKHPDVFYPEHFLDDQNNFFLPSEGFLPFIVGRRQCLGESLAKMELFLFLSAILQTFDIAEPLDDPIDLTCNPQSHHLLNFPRSQDLVLNKRVKSC